MLLRGRIGLVGQQPKAPDVRNQRVVNRKGQGIGFRFTSHKFHFFFLLNRIRCIIFDGEAVILDDDVATLDGDVAILNGHLATPDGDVAILADEVVQFRFFQALLRRQFLCQFQRRQFPVLLLLPLYRIFFSYRVFLLEFPDQIALHVRALCGIILKTLHGHRQGIDTQGIHRYGKSVGTRQAVRAVEKGVVWRNPQIPQTVFQLQHLLKFRLVALQSRFHRRINFLHYFRFLCVPGHSFLIFLFPATMFNKYRAVETHRVGPLYAFGKFFIIEIHIGEQVNHAVFRQHLPAGHY